MMLLTEEAGRSLANRRLEMHPPKLDEWREGQREEKMFTGGLCPAMDNYIAI